MTTEKLHQAEPGQKPASRDPARLRKRRILHLIYILLIIAIAILLFAWPPVASA